MPTLTAASGSLSTICLSIVAVDRDRTLPKSVEIDNRSHRAANQALDLHVAAVRLHEVALIALPARARKHRVLRRHPALPLPFQERRHAIFHGGSPQNVVFTNIDKARDICKFGQVYFERERS